MKTVVVVATMALMSFAAPASAQTGGTADCAGTAPQTATCSGSWVVEKPFGINFGYAHNFIGYLRIEGKTATYSIEIFCDVFLEWSHPDECDVTEIGFLEIGQTYTLTAVAPAFGYWFVKAPV